MSLGVYINLEWAPVLGKRCRARFKDVDFRGRCELRKAHKGDHAAERGMVWVRWREGVPGTWLTEAGSPNQGPPPPPNPRLGEPEDDFYTRWPWLRPEGSFVPDFPVLFSGDV